MTTGEAIDYFSKRHPLRSWATRRAVAARTTMFERFAAVCPFDETTTILDVGVTPDTELADSNLFESLYPFSHNITATSIEDASHLEARYPGLTFVRTDGGPLPFPDRHFDIAFCSAVVEHVGDTDRQAAFVAEIVRVSRRFFLTTPNRWFPIELHTFLPLLHWLPRAAHRWTLARIGLTFWARADNLNLLGKNELRSLFPVGTTVHVDGHRTAGLVSNLVAWGESPSSAP